MRKLEKKVCRWNMCLNGIEIIPLVFLILYSNCFGVLEIDCALVAVIVSDLKYKVHFHDFFYLIFVSFFFPPPVWTSFSCRQVLVINCIFLAIHLHRPNQRRFPWHLHTHHKESLAHMHKTVIHSNESTFVGMNENLWSSLNCFSICTRCFITTTFLSLFYIIFLRLL